ncbi:hypothetical protein Tco_0566525 [Tanacetum coccineum]
MYVEYLKEFLYTTEVEEETKTITFLLSWWDKPMSFTQDEFISAIGLPICKDVVPLPPKETVRAGLATLGSFDKDKPTLSSIVLVNSSPLKMKYFSSIWKLFMQYIVKCLGRVQGSHDQMNLNQQTIAYSLIWGLEIDIRGIIFSELVLKLQNGKKNNELNICYTRFLSLMFEKLLGRDYVNNDLTLVKPHTITVASFQKLLASKVPLTSHMIKVAKLSKEPGQSLIPPFGKVNVDDTADKSLSKASAALVTADATKSLVASELAEEQGNQLLAAKAKKVLDQNVKEEKDAEFVAMKEVAKEQSLEFPTVKQLLDEADKLNKIVQETLESPYDTESEIKVVKSFLTSHISELQDQTMHDSKETIDIHEGSDSNLQSMPDDELGSVSEFDTAAFNDTYENEVSKSDHIFQDDNVSAERLSLPDHMDHIYEELLKETIKSSVSKSIIEELPHVEAQVQKNLQDQLPNLLLKPMYKEFNAFNKLESQRFILLQKELRKSLHKNIRKSIRLKGKQPSTQVVTNEEKDLVVHNPEEMKFKITTPIPNPIPLNTFVLEHLLKPEEQQKSLHEFTDQLFGTTSLKFSPTPPREPTPSRDLAKGKEFTIVKE